MLRLSEEQTVILSCYSGSREDVIAEIRKAIPFIEDLELRGITEELIVQIENTSDERVVSIINKGMLDKYE